MPLMIGHSIMGSALTCTGAPAESRKHYDQAIALYNPAEHRPLATRVGQDLGVRILVYRSLTLWFLGYPDAALRATAEGKEFRATCGDEPRASLARPGQGPASARTGCYGWFTEGEAKAPLDELA